MAIGHMQDGELALGRELQQLVLADGLSRGRTPEPSTEAGDGGGGGGDLQKIPARQHLASILAYNAASPHPAPARPPNPQIRRFTC